MGCILNRVRSIPPFYSRKGGIPSEPSSIKTLPTSPLSPRRLPSILRRSQTGTIFNWFSKPILFVPSAFFRFTASVRISLDSLIPRSANPRPLPLATTYLSPLPGPPVSRFLSSILARRRVPLTGTSNQGYLRVQNPRLAILYSLLSSRSLLLVLSPSPSNFFSPFSVFPDS